MTADDVLNTVRLKNVLLSPDGKKVFYATEKLDWEKNKYISSYMMCDADGINTKVFLREGLDGNRFRFSPDSRFLSFLSKKDKKAQIFIIPVNGGESTQFNQPLWKRERLFMAPGWKRFGFLGR
jgi:dipeptidyl aminopeptidase/acylaminoacyl peptidase